MDVSIVEYLYTPGGPASHKCGYCKSPDTSMTQGVWAYRMSSRDFQDLVDRGFQRSGKYVYRPVMKKTCCPQYVIRLDTRAFRMSRAQRKTVNKMRRYLVDGLNPRGVDPDPEDISDKETGPEDQPRPNDSSRVGAECGDATTTTADACCATKDDQRWASGGVTPQDCGQPSSSLEEPWKPERDRGDGVEKFSSASRKTREAPDCESLPVQRKEGPLEKQASSNKKPVRKGKGPDPSKPLCRKAKVVRRERKAQKLLAGGGAGSDVVKPTNMEENATPQSLFLQDMEKLLAVPTSPNNAHHFTTQLVCCSPRSELFEETFQESYAVFRKFQTQVHKEKPEDCQERQFNDFLVDSPLRPEASPPGLPDYGSYHQQYLLDGRIFAVGVLDILPKGVVCEYLYYDPDYRFIAPGVYTALQEMALTQRYYQHSKDLQFYYMGFYVQSCSKMNYKARYAASYLLCPETYRYVPIDKCVPKLLQAEYSRLEEKDVPDSDPSDYPLGCYDHVTVVANMVMVQTYGNYRALHGDHMQDVVEEYVRVVGLPVASRMKVLLGHRFF